MDGTVQRMRHPALVVTLVALLNAGPLTGCGWARPQSTPSGHAAAPGRLALDVTESLGVARTQWPVTAGVPFAQGSMPDVAALHLSEDGRPLPVQARVLSRWPDGSARWALLDWQVDLAPGQRRHFTVDPGAAGPQPATRGAGALTVRDAGDHIEVHTGPLQFAIPKTRFAIMEQVRLNGAAAIGGPVAAFFNIDGKRVAAQPPQQVTITEAGPRRGRVELRGHYGSGFDYVVRVDAFANQPFVRVLHSFEQHSPEPYINVRQIGIDLPLALAGKATYHAGIDGAEPLSGALPPGGVSLVQEDNEGFRIDGTRQAGHAAGWVDLHDAAHGLAVISRYFWQEYPQSFELRSSGVTYNLWAPDTWPAKVGMGTAKTHEMFLLFHGPQAPSRALLAALPQPLLARMEPQFIVATQALRNGISATPASSPFLRELGAAYKRAQANADVERWDDSGQPRCPAPGAADAMHAAVAERPRRGFYGMFNWGDWNFHGYHDTTKGCDAWGNLEYDMTQVLALAYAATGEPGYFDGMVAAARHFSDVDHIYYADQPGLVGMNHPKNPLHFTFELGGVDLGHTWTEGLLSYYYFTGDTRSLDAALGTADYLVQRLRAKAPLKGNPRQFGWPQVALVAAYEASGDPRYKAAAIDYARRGMRAHPADRLTAAKTGAADWKMGILAEGIAYTDSISGDPEMRAWLLRYAGAVRARGDAIDPRYLPAVAYVGRLVHQPESTRAATAAAGRLKFGNWAKPFTIAGRLGFSLLSQALQPQ